MQVALVAAVHWSKDTAAVGVSFDATGAHPSFDETTQALIVNRALGPRGFLVRDRDVRGGPCATAPCAQFARTTRFVFAGTREIEDGTREVRFLILFAGQRSPLGPPTVTVLVAPRGDAWVVQKVSAGRP